MRVAIGAAIIRDGGILLVKKKQSWILPGGKPEFGEDDISCLCREVREELSGTEVEVIRFYKGFEGMAPHKGDKILAKVYFADIKGELHRHSAEIDAAEWVKNTKKYSLSDVTSKILASLQKDGYLRCHYRHNLYISHKIKSSL